MTVPSTPGAEAILLCPQAGRNICASREALEPAQRSVRLHLQRAVRYARMAVVPLLRCLPKHVRPKSLPSSQHVLNPMPSPSPSPAPTPVRSLQCPSPAPYLGLRLQALCRGCCSQCIAKAYSACIKPFEPTRPQGHMLRSCNMHPCCSIKNPACSGLDILLVATRGALSIPSCAQESWHAPSMDPDPTPAPCSRLTGQEPRSLLSRTSC